MILFDADAAGNTFRIAYGDPKTLTEYFDSLRASNAWHFDTGLALSPLGATNGRREQTRMRILERDASESAMCGNGSRAAAAVLALLGRRSELVVAGGAVGVDRIGPSAYRVHVPYVHLRGEQPWPLPHGAPAFRLVDVCGEPHAVALVDEADRERLEKWGQAIVPAANCTIATLHGGGIVTARTFERGVNRETRSCGTGAIAAFAAVFPEAEKRAAGTVRMNGHALGVTLTRNAAGVIRATLEGPVAVRERKEHS